MHEGAGFEAYAKVALEAKGLVASPLNLAVATRSLRESLSTTYHAVALDIDGTVTENVDDGLPTTMVKTLTGIVTKGAYVLFVTGGGRATGTKVLEQLRTSLEPEKLRRVCAITGSGCHLLLFDKNGGLASQSIGRPLKDALGEKKYGNLLESLQENLQSDFDVQEKACGVRLVSKADGASKDLVQRVMTWFEAGTDELRQAGMKAVAGRWGRKLTFDITQSDKDLALTWFYTEFDFLDVPILRVGDQGAEAGNDHSFLDSQHGFSVGTLSGAPGRCFPVVDEEDGRILRGVDGTEFLLEGLHWGPRLTMPPFLVVESVPAYRSALEKVERRASEVTFRLAKRWGDAAPRILPLDDVKRSVASGFDNLFDHKSGAIWVSDTEWSAIEGSPIGAYFVEVDSKARTAEHPGLLKSLHLDSGVILRGPRYYWGMSYPPSREGARALAEESLLLQTLVLEQLNPSDSKRPFLEWKTELALLDGFRNDCLLLYSMLFQAATLNTSSQPHWKRLLRAFEPYATAAIGLYYAHLTVNPDDSRMLVTDLRRSAGAFYELRGVVELLYAFLDGNKIDPARIIRKWREVDHPGQILVALSAAEERLRTILKGDKRVCVLGLMYGGVELPFALRYLFRGISGSKLTIAHLGGISFYRRERGALIMEQYAHDILESAIPNTDRLEEVLAPEDIAVIADDNVMTGRTIELARDRLLAYGVSVPFCVCIRYPPEHRISQMAMRRHGGIDPEALGRDVIGLVAQSPYSRKFSTSGGYEDVLGVFDRSRERVHRYLKKNGIVLEEN